MRWNYQYRCTDRHHEVDVPSSRSEDFTLCFCPPAPQGKPGFPGLPGQKGSEGPVGKDGQPGLDGFPGPQVKDNVLEEWSGQTAELE